MQAMFGILTGVEFDAHRQTLHHLDIIAGRVFCGQQTEPIAARARQVSNVAAVVAAERIDVDGDLLAAMHAGELCLLEVCGHPDLVGFRYEHQRLAGSMREPNSTLRLPTMPLAGARIAV